MQRHVDAVLKREVSDVLTLHDLLRAQQTATDAPSADSI
jgi:hypothetical protein